MTLGVINLDVIFSNEPDVFTMSSSRPPALRSAYMATLIILPNQRFITALNQRLRVTYQPPLPSPLQLQLRFLTSNFNLLTILTSFLGPFNFIYFAFQPQLRVLGCSQL